MFSEIVFDNALKNHLRFLSALAFSDVFRDALKMFQATNAASEAEGLLEQENADPVGIDRELQMAIGAAMRHVEGKLQRKYEENPLNALFWELQTFLDTAQKRADEVDFDLLETEEKTIKSLREAFKEDDQIPEGSPAMLIKQFMTNPNA